MSHDEAYRAGFFARPLPVNANDAARRSWAIGRARATASVLVVRPEPRPDTPESAPAEEAAL